MIAYSEYLINGGLTVLLLSALAAVVVGFASAMTNSEFGGRVWPWVAACISGILLTAFAAVTIAYRMQS